MECVDIIAKNCAAIVLNYFTYTASAQQNKIDRSTFVKNGGELIGDETLRTTHKHIWTDYKS